MRSAAGRALVLAVIGLCVASCGVVSTVNRVKNDVEANKAAIDTFTGKFQQGGAVPFEATYVTTGSSPATVVYAVSPPTGLLFRDTPSGGGSSGAPRIYLVVDAGGEYSCSPPSARTGPKSHSSCQQLAPAAAAVRNKIFDLYTPSHWTAFLKGLSIAAGFAGDKVSSSTRTVNGFAMSCVDLVASGVDGTSTICTTAQGILGYVKVASEPTSFEITAYTSKPAPTLFALPKGAIVTPAKPS